MKLTQRPQDTSKRLTLKTLLQLEKDLEANERHDADVNLMRRRLVREINQQAQNHQQRKVWE
jgi:hypothetical protein